MTPITDADILKALGVMVVVMIAGLWRLLG